MKLLVHFIKLTNYQNQLINRFSCHTVIHCHNYELHVFRGFGVSEKYLFTSALHLSLYFIDPF